MLKKTALALVVVMASGCQTYDAYTGEEKTSSATKGAAAGAVGGALIGAMTGDSKSAAIGAAIGAAAGGGLGYYMDKQESELRAELEGTGVRVVRNGDEITLVMPGNITFDTDKSNVRDSFFPTLDSIAVVLNKYDDTTIEVSGHTDSTGASSYNEALSQRRAVSVTNYLAWREIPQERMRAVGYGARYPIASNASEAGRAANRRVEMRLLPR